MDYKLPKDYKKPDKFKQVEFDQFNHQLYNSPITLVQSAIETQIEDGVLKAVQEVGFDVDPKELYKALQYDRNQYEKGYADAKRQYDRGHGHWIEFWDYLKCSNCDYGFTEHNDTKRFSYCPNCGAKMDEEFDDE